MRLQGLEREWIVADAVPAADSEPLAQALGVPRIGAELLLRRGVSDPDAAAHFLEPRLRALRDPFGLPDMRRAVERGWAAIDRGEAILVHGDYDVDGMVGTAFLVRMLRALGGKVTYFLPERVRDGYGLTTAGLDAAEAAAARLIIAVDCGVTAVAETEAARGRGIDLVILDHHQPPPELPRAVAVVDAQREDSTYPFRELCGVGVAAKFIQGMAIERPGVLDPRLFVEALQLAALGTIADVVPLIDENRTFVHHGLRALSVSSWPGIRALKDLARLNGTSVDAGQVAFQLAPRLNATGRMGAASLGVELLLSESTERAALLAREVEAQNQRRREADQATSASARAMALALENIPAALVFWSDDWPAGVIGIAAARLAEEFHRPSLLIGMNGELGRGSARSYGGFDIGRAFAACRDLLEAHGGHSQAAGLSVRRENLEALRARLVALAADAGATTRPEPLALDGELSPEEIDLPLMDFLGRLAPFGAGSPEPLFLLRGLRLVEPPRIVGGDHLRLTIGHGRRRFAAIGFNLGRLQRRLAEAGGQATLAATPCPDDYRGGGAIQLRFRDVMV